MRLARFYRYFARNRMTPDVASLFINLFHSLSPFPQLSLFGAGIVGQKNEYVSQHTMRVSTCIIHVQLAGQ